ncbi:MAG: ABC transporter substrate-binding protein [Lachnospiraceae bacterium]|nr:ABC transporter substrate-binding protein [Lachnospiraceae bacterium]
MYRKTRREKHKITGVTIFLLSAALLFCMAGCGRKEDASDEAESTLSQDNPPEHIVTIGFSQIGSESDWRMASTKSVQEAFAAHEGFELIYNDGQQKQENQIKAIREFIDQDVDYILLDPCVETGWDSALLEAKEAGIPVIVYDREVVVSDNSLYTAWIGSDFYLEGKKACTWLREYLQAIGYYGDVNIVDIQGTFGASAQIGRSRALDEAVSENSRWHLIGQETGDFTTSKGREVMEEMLIQHGGNINVVYCENDNEAYGAIEAITKAGYKIGSDFAAHEMLILSFDSTSEGLRLTKEGKIAVNTECSPLYGPRLVRMIEQMEAGEKPEFRTYIEEEQFSAFTGIGSLRIDGDSYFVTRVTDELLDEREY